MFFRRYHFSSRGSVLIAALWAIFLLTLFAVQLGGIVRQKLASMDRLDNREQLYLIADAGVQRAFAEIRRTDQTTDYDTLNEPWSSNEFAFQDIPVGKGFFNVVYSYQNGGRTESRYGVSDEESRININTATVDVLTRLLSGQGGLDSDRAMELAYQIVDWRDNDSFFEHPQYGAEDDDYKSLSAPYEAKDADFETLEELLLVRGMTPQVFRKIKNFVTIYSEGSVNINTVSQEVLSAYGLSDSMVDDIMSFRAGADLEEGTADDGFFRTQDEIVSKVSQMFGLSVGDVAGLSNFVSTFNPGTVSHYFRVRSVAHLNKGDQQLEIIAVVDRGGQVRYWHEDYKVSRDGGE